MTAYTPLVLNPPPNITKVIDDESLEKLKDFFTRCDNLCGWDIETDPKKDYYWRRARTVQFGNAQEQYVIDLLAWCDSPDVLFACQGDYGKNLHLAPRLQKLLDVISPVLTNPNFTKVGVNLSFEYMTFYWNFGIRSCGFFDCAMVERVIYAGLHSLKDYGFYSMEEMFGRYFLMTIDKSLQESFNLTDPLSDAQYEYAALDTRTPLAIRMVQLMILSGATPKTLREVGKPKMAEYLERVDQLVLGDDLREAAKIENDAIGAFQDMHIHGERIDRERWLARVAKKKVELLELLKNMDEIFLPIVGSKHSNITDAEIEKLTAEWKEYNNPTDKELKLKASIRDKKKLGFPAVEEELLLANLIATRLQIKETKKAECSEVKKHRTKIKNLAAKCEGEALINYGSDAQLKKVLHEHFPALKEVTNLDDDTLEKYEKYPVMKLIREYHGISKEIDTYGDAWAMEWVTNPSQEEGWLHPGDGRLHAIYNQYDAATGRSTSEKPNGQNLPQDKEVRSCFIADPPDADEPEGYVYVTADMSGAELRIIAECADDKVWIGAFERGEDVHSVGTELLHPEEWPKAALPDCAYYKVHTEETVKKNPLCKIGEPQRQKCNCPKHKELRDDNKSTNFLLAYGGGASTLAARLKKPMKFASKLMSKHEMTFPKIWAYLNKSGKEAQLLKRSFDMFGGRRIFPPPDYDRAREAFIEYHGEKLLLDKEEQVENIKRFIEQFGRKPDADERWELTHRKPTDGEIRKQYMGMHGSIERAGKNHRIQGTNAKIAKLAMGSGYDSIQHKPYLWHTLPQYKAKLVKFVHDELVVMCPKRYGEKVAELIGDAFKRAAAEKMKKVVMEFDYKIAGCWTK